MIILTRPSTCAGRCTCTKDSWSAHERCFLPISRTGPIGTSPIHFSSLILVLLTLIVGIEKDRESVESGLTTSVQRASFNAARSRHSGDWLLALPIVPCGLKLDDEAVRVAVGIRLALILCVPHQCRCGTQIDSFGRHSLVCNRAPGRIVRHHQLNDVIARSLASTGVPVSEEPSGLSRSDGKRPDGLTLIPWRAGRSLIWDVTVSCTTADSYMEASSCEAGAAAELAASNKVVKYAGLSSQVHSPRLQWSPTAQSTGMLFGS